MIAIIFMSWAFAKMPLETASRVSKNRPYGIFLPALLTAMPTEREAAAIGIA